MYFQRLPNYTNSLQLISALIILLLGTTSIALPAPLAACASDRKRLCGTFIGRPSAVQKCMIAHCTELSAGCAAAPQKGALMLATAVVAPNVLHMSNGSTFRKMGEQRQTTGSLGGQN